MNRATSTRYLSVLAGEERFSLTWVEKLVSSVPGVDDDGRVIYLIA